jgi:uncharacterized membrane-anchored protein
VTRRAVMVLAALVGLQAAFPLGIVAWNEWKIRTGTEVRLRTGPVDPVDPFRGRYITLRYEISRISVSDAEAGDTVYVVLRNAGDRWTGDRATTERPSDDETFIRGRVRYGGGGFGEVEYGIETYYVDEDKARELESAAASRRMFVDVSLDDDGTARIKDVHPPS